MLLDITAVDYSSFNKNIEITYCFLNIYNSLRFFLKTYTLLLMPVPSLSKFYLSAN